MANITSNRTNAPSINRPAATQLGPSSGTAMRWNRNELPQIMANKIKRSVEAKFMANL